VAYLTTGVHNNTPIMVLISTIIVISIVTYNTFFVSAASSIAISTGSRRGAMITASREVPR
jgi:Ca2+/H+ antiporter